MFLPQSMFAGNDNRTDSAECINMQLDTVYRPFPDIESFTHFVRRDYRYCRGDKKSPEILIAEVSPKELHSIFFSSHVTKSVSYMELELEDMMKGLRDVLEDLKKDYDISLLGQITIDALAFGSASIEVCRKYEQGLEKGKKYDGDLLRKLYSESRFFSAINDVLSAYHLKIGNFFFEKVMIVKRETYLNYYGFQKYKDDIPEQLLSPWMFVIEIEKTDEAKGDTVICSKKITYR